MLTIPVPVCNQQKLCVWLAKIHRKWFLDPSVKRKSIKLLEDDRGGNLYNFGDSNDF